MIRRLLRNRGASLGAVLSLLLVVVALVGPLLAPYDPVGQDLAGRLEGPSPAHIFGTDQFGRDVLSRLLYGAQISALVGLVAVLVGAVLGIAVGAVAGYYSGRGIDTVLMRIVDSFMAFPSLLFALLLLTMLGGGVLNVILAIGITTSPRFARLVRASVLQLSASDFVTSVRAIGARDVRIVVRHLLPNALSPIIVLATLRIASAILTEANLSFLGLGVTAPTATWGNMISDGRLFIYRAPWISLIPGLSITLAVLGVNLLGDGIRDALDPRLRER